ncbi:unnamed protein product [Larinioides sclopetarius]|uniref:Uncharacterized protein n=1 Tax=Larinioides sclopetarius TaxID=280406 RepID=A0AAV1ZNS9_9ARAC
MMLRQHEQSHLSKVQSSGELHQLINQVTISSTWKAKQNFNEWIYTIEIYQPRNSVYGQHNKSPSGKPIENRRTGQIPDRKLSVLAQNKSFSVSGVTEP